MARYKIKLDQRGREVAAAQSSVRAITAEARRHIDATFPGFDPAACFRPSGAAHASLHFYAADHEWWAYPDNPTTWLVGVCVPYNPQFAPRVREIRPTEAVREVMRQHGWSWQIVEWQTRLALQACEEADYPMTEFAIPITQVQFYTWPIGDSDEIVRLDLYEPPWERADIDPLKRTQ
jgi:hypothetical protein